MENVVTAYYEKVEELYHFEFGICYYDSQIEIIVIDHESLQVRTLGWCKYVTDAITMLETCIQYGFDVKGLSFSGIPGFHLKRKLDSLEV